MAPSLHHDTHQNKGYLTSLASAILLTILIGTRNKPIPPEDLYFADTLNRADRTLRWSTSLGTVIVLFSLIAAAALVFGFIAA